MCFQELCVVIICCQWARGFGNHSFKPFFQGEHFIICFNGELPSQFGPVFVLSFGSAWLSSAVHGLLWSEGIRGTRSEG